MLLGAERVMKDCVCSGIRWIEAILEANI